MFYLKAAFCQVAHRKERYYIVSLVTRKDEKAKEKLLMFNLRVESSASQSNQLKIL